MKDIIWKEACRYKTDNMPETTDAIIMVSNNGKVKRLEYKAWNKYNNSYSTYGEKYYSITSNRGKQRHESEDKIKRTRLYQYVSFNNKSHSVHRLVAKAFIPNPENKTQVNHINGIRDDNRVENLEWVSNKENYNHAQRTGLFNHIRGTGSYQDKETIDQIMNLSKEGLSCKRIANKLNNKISHETIRLILKDKNINHKTIIKKRKRKSKEYYDKKRKEYLDNFSITKEEEKEILNYINNGYSKQELKKYIKNINQKLEAINIDTRKIFSENIALRKQIEEKDRGIRKKGNRYYYRFGTSTKTLYSTNNYNDVLEYKNNFIFEKIKDKKILLNIYYKNKDK